MHDDTKWADLAVPPAPKPKERRRAGRPRTEIKTDAPLFKLPGPTNKEKLEQLYDRWFSCTRCALGEWRESEGCGEDLVFFEGNPDAHVLLVGEAPGEEEEKAKKPFVGRSGKLLNQIIANTSDDPEIQELFAKYNKGHRTQGQEDKFHEAMFEYRAQEFGITNIVSCRPPENRAPTLTEMKACWERLWNIIYIVDPLLIIAFGNTAVSGVTRKLSAQITKVRGQIFDVTYDGMVGELMYPVMPLLHPSFLLRAADYRLPDGYYQKTVRDFRSAMQMADFLRNKHFGTPMPDRSMR